MECSKCHNEIKPGQEVCLSCGHILGYESEISKKCRHCNREIPINYKKCPYCKKRQGSKRSIIINLIIVITIIINTLIYIDLYGDNYMLNNNYREDCTSISYQDLVKKNKYYDESYVTLTGKVIRVREVNRFFNRIEIEIFIDNQNEIIKVRYNNRDSIGLVNGDRITIYGKYKRLSGNTPIINSKIIDVQES